MVCGVGPLGLGGRTSVLHLPVRRSSLPRGWLRSPQRAIGIPAWPCWVHLNSPSAVPTGIDTGGSSEALSGSAGPHRLAVLLPALGPVGQRERGEAAANRAPTGRHRAGGRSSVTTWHHCVGGRVEPQPMAPGRRSARPRPPHQTRPRGSRRRGTPAAHRDRRGRAPAASGAGVRARRP